MTEVIYKINPIEDYLVANGYKLQPKLHDYAKPRYKKGDNEVIVCWSCGWAVINGGRIMFRSTGLKKLFDLIPLCPKQ